MDKHNNIQQLNQTIRDFLNSSKITKTEVFLKKDKGFWNQLWVCIDTIDDTELALNNFVSLNTEDFEKSAYINTYGLLQALYLQQDAVNNLKESLLNEKINWSKDYPSVFNIRDIRNETTGHPTKNIKKKEGIVNYCTIDRSSISKNGFNYMLWRGKEVEQKRADFLELIQNQQKALFKELSKILTELNYKEINHKTKFKGKNLSSLLPNNNLYSFKILRQIAYDELAWRIFLSYKETYSKIKKGIEDRYGALDKMLRIQGTKILIDELDNIFAKIFFLKNDKQNNEMDINIYSDALVQRLSELKDHLKEIDEEFSKI